MRKGKSVKMARKALAKKPKEKKLQEKYSNVLTEYREYRAKKKASKK